MRLAIHDQRVDAAPDIVDDGVAGDVDPSGLGIDLGFADRTAIGKDRIVNFIAGNDGEPALQPKGALPPDY